MVEDASLWLVHHPVVEEAEDAVVEDAEEAEDVDEDAVAGSLGRTLLV